MQFYGQCYMIDEGDGVMDAHGALDDSGHTRSLERPDNGLIRNAPYGATLHT